MTAVEGDHAVVAGAEDDHAVVTGIGVVSPRGFDASAASKPRQTPDHDWFDYRTHLGRRGYKYLPSAAQYFLAATNRALDEHGAFVELPAALRGAVIGTNSATDSLHADMDQTILAVGANGLSPATAPYFSVNLFGSRTAMEHSLQGFNLTLTSPRVAGLEALQVGLRSLRAGRASWLLAGVAEEEPGDSRSDTAEQGAVALTLESAGRVRARGGEELGRLEVRTFFLPPSVAATDVGRQRLDRLLALTRRSGADGRFPEVRAVVDDSEVSEAVVRSLGADLRRFPAGSGALEPMLQVSEALRSRGEAITVIVTAAAQGNVAVARISPASPHGADRSESQMDQTGGRQK